MMTTLKSKVMAMALSALALPAMGQTLTADDYCSPRKTAPARVKEMRPMADGVSYTAISDNGKSIDIFSYKTGQKTGTLFDVDNVKGDVKISEFRGYKISANGKKVLLWNDNETLFRRSFKAEYFVYDIARNTLKRVSTKGKQRGATMSHDGRMVAYVRDNNIFISNLDYDTDNAITTDGKINEIINGTSDWVYEEELSVVNTMRWSADDNVLAYIRFDESKVPVYSFDDYRSYCVPDPDKDLYPAAFKYKYPLPGYPNSIVSVKAYDLNTRVTKTMDLPIGENDYVPSMEFDGKGINLMVMILNRDQNDLTLYKVNPGSTVGTPIYNEKTSNGWLAPSAYQMVTYFPETFVIGSERDGWCHLYEYDYSGALKKQLTKGDFNVTTYYGRNAAGEEFVQCTRLGAVNRNVARLTRKGELQLLNNVPGTESASFSKNFEFYVRTYSNVTTPPQYTVWSTKGKKIADLELNEAYAAKYANAPKRELMKVKNANGEEMDAFVIKGANASSEKLPLLMVQYNGPGSQRVLNSWTMGGEYYIASQGYVVGCVDGRGTGGRSREWTQCVYKHLGDFEVDDQIAGALELAKLPYVDESRLGCWGWSYGGYMTLMELGHTKSPFKAGVSMAPVTDWRFYDSIYTERYMSTPQQNPEGYAASSALARTKNVKARLLIMSGTSDDNVHFYNTLKYTSKLNYEGTTFDMMAFTGFEHGLPLCNARLMLYRKVVDFLNIYLK